MRQNETFIGTLSFLILFFARATLGEKRTTYKKEKHTSVYKLFLGNKSRLFKYKNKVNLDINLNRLVNNLITNL